MESLDYLNRILGKKEPKERKKVYKEKDVFENSKNPYNKIVKI
jgi:hypothetical protein